MSTKAKKASVVPTNEEIAQLARKLKGYDLDVKEYTLKRDNLKPKLVEMMQRAKTTLVEALGVRVVLSSPSTTVYDEDAIYIALTPKQRKMAFDDIYNFSLLPAAKRKELERQMFETLTPSQLRLVASHKFNLSRMSQAVQEGKIPIEVLAENTSEEPKTPYTTITIKGTGNG